MIRMSRDSREEEKETKDNNANAALPLRVSLRNKNPRYIDEKRTTAP